MLSKNSWISIDFDHLPQRTKQENLLVQFHRKAKNILPFDKACDLVAKEIADTCKNIFLCLSGGCDSENVANTFVRNGIDFTVLIVNYNQIINRSNRHNIYKDMPCELDRAYEWCRHNQIVPLEIDASKYIGNDIDRQNLQKVKPRITNGHGTSNALQLIAQEHNASLVAGYQLEYYPDHEQMEYLEPCLKTYRGFVMEESDVYIEIMRPDQHPWAFYYWSPEIMASFAYHWDENLTMQQNKSQIYKIPHRQKFLYQTWLYHRDFENYAQSKWGTRDCALLGTKQHLLSQLLE